MKIIPLGKTNRAYVVETRLGHKYLALAPSLQLAILCVIKQERRPGGDGEYWQGLTSATELVCEAVLTDSLAEENPEEPRKAQKDVEG